MDIDVDYAVKRFFPSPTFAQIYFEAVANAFDAGASVVDITILTDGRSSGRDLEIIIRDNGAGFTDSRFERFKKLTEPVDRYHKGLGRLVYLHYFTHVEVASTFGSKKRTFMFSKEFTGSSEEKGISPSDDLGTVLTFRGFRGQRIKSYDVIKPGALRDMLMEQFLPLFHDRKKKGQEFTIRIGLNTESKGAQKELASDSTTITLADVPALECKNFKDDAVDQFASIDMYYWVRADSGAKLRMTAVCVDGRTIPYSNLLSPSAIPLNYSVIFLFESELFTGGSDTARQRLVLADSISEPALRRALRREMSSVLNEKLPEIAQKNETTKEEVEKRYPHLMGLFDEDTVGLIDRDEVIGNAQARFFKQQKEVLESDSLDSAAFEKSIEVSSRALMEYVLYREVIIKKLSAMTADHDESEIHGLIVPQRRSFHGHELTDGIYNNNAWLLDDKFMSFRTILSEARMQELISAIALKDGAEKDEGRPDISMIFSADPKDAIKVDVVVVELKKRANNMKENTFSYAQLLQRARKLVDHCPMIQRMWYFGIIEIDASLSRHLRDDEWIPLFSKGTVFYRERRLPRDDGSVVIAPFYLLSYDAVIRDAADRNHTFLEILKCGFKKASQDQETNGSAL